VAVSPYDRCDDRIDYQVFSGNVRFLNFIKKLQGNLHPFQCICRYMAVGIQEITNNIRIKLLCQGQDMFEFSRFKIKAVDNDSVSADAQTGFQCFGVGGIQDRGHLGHRLYGIHSWDLKLYDLVIHTKKIPVDFAADTICRTVGVKSFHTTLESQKAVDDLLLAAEAKWALVDLNPHAEVSGHDGSVTVKTILETVSSKSQEESDKLVGQIEKIVKRIPGIKEVNIDATKLWFAGRIEVDEDGSLYVAAIAPSPPIMELLSSGRKYYFLPIEAEWIKKGFDYSKDQEVLPALVKKGAMKGLEQDIPALVGPGVIQCDASLPDEVVEEIVRVRHEYR